MGGLVEIKNVDTSKLKRDHRGILWADCIGEKIYFQYGEIKGFVTVLNYKKEKQRLTFQYNDKVINMASYSFINGNFGNFLGTCTMEYKLNIGDKVNGAIILEKIKVKNGKKNGKGYLMKCTTDQYEYSVSEKMLLIGNSCPLCSGKVTVKGVNDIATTRPDMMPYLFDKEDGYRYCYSSNKRIELMCPDCGTRKTLSPNYVSKRGYRCSQCSDGYTYPEKFVLNIIKQLGYTVETQLCKTTFDWCGSYRYDIYINEINCIIETHGVQHYESDCIINKMYNTLENQLSIDAEKREIALLNSIDHYIELDCRESEIKWIKRSVLDSELPKLLNFKEDDIDWLRCHEFAVKSRVKEVCNMWNSGVHSTRDIGVVMGLSPSTCLNYLKQGLSLKWCDYSVDKARKYTGSKNKTSTLTKEVLIYDANYNLIYLAISTRDAQDFMEKTLSVKADRRLISHACSSKSHYCKGYYFKYKKDVEY